MSDRVYKFFWGLFIVTFMLGIGEIQEYGDMIIATLLPGSAFFVLAGWWERKGVSRGG